LQKIYPEMYGVRMNYVFYTIGDLHKASCSSGFHDSSWAQLSFLWGLLKSKVSLILKQNLCLKTHLNFKQSVYTWSIFKIFPLESGTKMKRFGPETRRYIKFNPNSEKSIVRIINNKVIISKIYLRQIIKFKVTAFRWRFLMVFYGFLRVCSRFIKDFFSRFFCGFLKFFMFFFNSFPGFFILMIFWVFFVMMIVMTARLC
jgi:hypothetical protein